MLMKMTKKLMTLHGKKTKMKVKIMFLGDLNVSNTSFLKIKIFQNSLNDSQGS